MNTKRWLGLVVGAVVATIAWGADLPGVKDLPDMKEGLWESSTMMPGSMDRPMRTTMCTSNAVSRKVYEDSHQNPDTPCKGIHIERAGSVITEETQCNSNGKVTLSKSITTLTGNTGMHIEMRDADNKVETMIDMKWVGACPPGMKLGDITGPDGKVMMNAMSR